MKTLLLILCLATSAAAQQDWKLLKEMSGDIPDHPGLTVEAYASEIRRGEDRVRLQVKIEFPGGAPRDMLQPYVPWGFDASSITRMVAKIDFNCKTLEVRPVNGSAEVYQFNGKKHKSKEPPFKIDYGHIFAIYFCERGTTPKTPPKLKP